MSTADLEVKMCEGDGVMRIALWGYGGYGKKLFRTLRKNWIKRYSVTAVFDCSVENDDEVLLEGEVPLMKTERVAGEYRAGRFEAVLISVVNDGLHAEIEESLRCLGVPSMTLITQAELLSMEAFENVSSRDLPFGFVLHEYESIYGFYVSLYSWGTHLYLFDDCGHPLADNWFLDYLNYDFGALNPAFPFDKTIAPVVHLAGDYCAISRNWGKNYWHCTYQLLDQIAVMEESGFGGMYLMPRASYTEELVALAGIDVRRIVWLDDFNPDTLYSFERVFIVAEKAYNYERSAQVLLKIAKLIKENAKQLEDRTREFPSRLFVRRILNRRLLGVDDLLDAYGFQAIVPEELTVAEQVQYFSHADIVLSPHGANSTNSLYMRPGSAFIETFGRGWAYLGCVETLRLNGVHYFPVVQTPIPGDGVGSYSSDYWVNKSILKMAIESAIQLTE